MTMHMKFAIVGGIGFLALIFLVAGLATHLADRSVPLGDGNTLKMWMTITSSCAKVNGHEQCQSYSDLNDGNGHKCGKLVGMTKSILAFGIIAGLMTGAGSLAGFIGIASPLVGKVGGLLLLAAAMCTLIVWPMAVAFYTTPMCEGPNAEALSRTYKMGPCAPLIIVAWLLMLAGGIAGLVMPTPPRTGNDAMYVAVAVDGSNAQAPKKVDLYGTDADASVNTDGAVKGTSYGSC